MHPIPNYASTPANGTAEPGFFDRLEWVRDLEMPAKYKTVLTALVLRTDSRGECYPSRRRLCRDTGLKHPVTISKRIRWLAHQGYITVKEGAGKNGGATSNTYSVKFGRCPAQAADRRAADTGNPHSPQANPPKPMGLAPLAHTVPEGSIEGPEEGPRGKRVETAGYAVGDLPPEDRSRGSFEEREKKRAATLSAAALAAARGIVTRYKRPGAEREDQPCLQQAYWLEVLRKFHPSAAPPRESKKPLAPVDKCALHEMFETHGPSAFDVIAVALASWAEFAAYCRAVHGEDVARDPTAELVACLAEDVFTFVTLSRDNGPAQPSATPFEAADQEVVGSGEHLLGALVAGGAR